MRRRRACSHRHHILGQISQSSTTENLCWIIHTFVTEQELDIGEPEHAERLLIAKSDSDGLNVASFQLRNRPWLLLVESHDLEA